MPARLQARVKAILIAFADTIGKIRPSTDLGKLFSSINAREDNGTSEGACLVGAAGSGINSTPSAGIRFPIASISNALASVLFQSPAPR